MNSLNSSDPLTFPSKPIKQNAIAKASSTEKTSCLTLIEDPDILVILTFLASDYVPKFVISEEKSPACNISKTYSTDSHNSDTTRQGSSIEYSSDQNRRQSSWEVKDSY